MMMIKLLALRAAGRLCRSDNGLYRGRVLLGPLRGTQIVMPGFERPSYLLGAYERHLARAIRKHVSPGHVAYDIGAHIGYVSLLLARAAGPTGAVYAFEPDPRNRSALEHNVGRLDNVHVIDMAVSDHAGTVEFASFGYSLVGHLLRPDTPDDASVFRVPCITIDEFAETHPPPDFLKIDVEGAEDRVLTGAQRTLERYRPVLVVEVRGLLQSWRTILDFMDRLGYSRRCLRGSTEQGDGLADVLFAP